jgi:hypothetical protein
MDGFTVPVVFYLLYISTDLVSAPECSFISQDVDCDAKAVKWNRNQRRGLAPQELLYVHLEDIAFERIDNGATESGTASVGCIIVDTQLWVHIPSC